jgi:hypothetical protein
MHTRNISHNEEWNLPRSPTISRACKARFLLVSVVLGPRAPGRLPRSFVINFAELTISYAHRTGSMISTQFNMNALVTTGTTATGYIQK